jgi:hypothetical protein
MISYYKSQGTYNNKLSITICKEKKVFILLQDQKQQNSPLAGSANFPPPAEKRKVKNKN